MIGPLIAGRSAKTEPYRVWVSPTGSDAAAGTETAPLLTLGHAQVHMAAAIAAGSTKDGGGEVILRNGSYAPTSTITFTAADSGRFGKPIVWKAENDGMAIIDGGVALTGWIPLTSGDAPAWAAIPSAARSHVYVCDLNALGIDATACGTMNKRGIEDSTQISSGEALLVCNDEMMTLAQYPNGTTYLLAPTGADDFTAPIEFVPGAPDAARVAAYAYDTAVSPGGACRAWIGGWFGTNSYVQRYAYSRISLSAIDPGTGKLTFATVPIYSGVRKDNRYKIINVLEELDDPGEYYLDRTTLKLYFYPPVNVTAGMLETSCKLATFAGTSQGATFYTNSCDNITFRGIVFQNMRATPIIVRGSQNTIQNCTFRNLGSWAIRSNNITGYNTIVDSCNMYNLGAGGVELKSPGYYRGIADPLNCFANLIPSGHIVSNCHIHHYQRLDQGSCHAIQMQGVGIKATHNLIEDAPWQAIWFGGCDNEISWNEIARINTATSDCGAIYGGRQLYYRGNNIHHNYIHDMIDYVSGWQEIHMVYLDDRLSGVTVESNVFENGGNGMYNAGGRDNYIHNNVCKNCNTGLRLGDGGTATFASSDTATRTADLTTVLGTPGGTTVAAYTDLVIDGTTNTKISSALRPFTHSDIGRFVDVTSGTGFYVQTGQIVAVVANVAMLSGTNTSYTDIVIDGATNTDATSAAHPFTAADVGSSFSITGGTGFTVQVVTLTSIVGGVVARFSAALGTVGSTGGAATKTFSIGAKSSTGGHANLRSGTYPEGRYSKYSGLLNILNEEVISPRRTQILNNVEFECDIADPATGSPWLLGTPATVVETYSDSCNYYRPSSRHYFGNTPGFVNFPTSLAITPGGNADLAGFVPWDITQVGPGGSSPVNPVVNSLTMPTDRYSEINSLFYNAIHGDGIVNLPAGIIPIGNNTISVTEYDGLTINGDAVGGSVLCGGVIVPSDSIRALASTDPLYSRVPAGIRTNVKVVNLTPIGLSTGSFQATAGGNNDGSLEGTDPIDVFWGGERLKLAEEYTGWRNATGASTNVSITTDVTAPASCNDLRIAIYPNQNYYDVHVGVASWVSTTVTFTTAPCTGNILTTGSGARFKLYNAVEWLASGTFCIDTTNNTLYLYPATSVATCIVSTATGSQLSVLRGSNLVLNNVGAGYGRGRGITVDSTVRVTVNGGSFGHCTYPALVLDSCTHVLVDGADFTDSAGHLCAYIDNRLVPALAPSAPFITDDGASRSVSGVLGWNIDRVQSDPSVRFTNCTFSKSGQRYRRGLLLALEYETSKSVGVQVDACTFEDAPAGAIRWRGFRFNITGNSFARCISEVTEAGVIYGGRSYTDWGTRITNNTFTDCNQGPAGVTDYPAACIFLDDQYSGCTVTGNTFTRCSDYGIINTGAYNDFRSNTFDTCTGSLYQAVWTPYEGSYDQWQYLRSQIGVGWKAAFAAAPWNLCTWWGTNPTLPLHEMDPATPSTFKNGDHCNLDLCHWYGNTLSGGTPDPVTNGKAMQTTLTQEVPT